MAQVAIRALAGGGARPLAVHFGAGIARRDDYNEQRAAHHEALERGTVALGLPALPVVAVPAASIVVAEGGSNYRPVAKSEGKQEKQARRKAKAAAAARHDARRRASDGDVQPSLEGQPLVGTASEGSDSDELSDDERPAPLGRRKRTRPTLCLAFGQQALAEGAAAAAGTPPAPLLSPHGYSLSKQLRFLRRRLCEYVVEQTAVGGVVMSTTRGGGMQYPTEQWTVHFFKWLRACV